MAGPESDLRRWWRKWSRRTFFLGAVYLLLLDPVWNLLLSHFQAEATTMLDAVVLSERGHFQGDGSWTDEFSGLDLDVGGSTKYTIFLSPTEHRGRSLAELGLTLPVDFAALGAPEPGLTDDGFVAVAVGNIDLDKELDVWWVDQTGVIRNPRSDVWGVWRYLQTLYQKTFSY